MKFRILKKENNILGFDIIEILQFNYDGKGTALALADGDFIELDSKELLREVLFGDNNGNKNYGLIINSL